MNLQPDDLLDDGVMVSPAIQQFLRGTQLRKEQRAWQAEHPRLPPGMVNSVFALATGRRPVTHPRRTSP